MSKVLFLVNHAFTLYNFRLELVERLLRDGHKVVISSPLGDGLEQLQQMGCAYEQITLSRHGTNPIQELALIREYKKLLKKVRPDIVFSYTIKPNIYGAIAARSCGVPFVANITGLGTAVENPGPVQRISVLLYKYAFSGIEKVFFQNRENMQFFVDRKIALGRHDLLPGSGVNLTRFSPLDFPQSETVEFAFISRIMREKGIEQYLEAAHYIREKYPNTVFHICGFCEQNYEERLRELTDRGKIVYHGMVRDVRTVLKDIHCTVHPTYYPEGMSNVLLESCACGRPIITTDRAGCREIIDNGVTGFVCRQQDAVDLIAQIEKFLALSHEERVQMGRAAREKVAREFDRNIVVEKYIAELKKHG